MKRRTFLQLASVGTAAGFAGGLSRLDPRPLLADVPDAPLFPGLPLAVGLRPDAGGPCHVAVVLDDGDSRQVVATHTLQPGQAHSAPLGFVSDALEAGEWHVDLVAVRDDGAARDTLRVGQFRVRSLRFGV